MPVQADSCSARLPNEGNAGWPVMANTGMPLSCAQATPVIRLVAPGRRWRNTRRVSGFTRITIGHEGGTGLVACHHARGPPRRSLRPGR